MRANLPPKDQFLGITFDSFRSHRICEHIHSGNNGHLYRAHADNIEGDLAFKVVPVANLEEGTYLEEARRANRLDHRSVVRCHAVFPFLDESLSCPYVIFVYDFIRGKNLRQFIGAHPSEIDLPFVERFLTTMFELLYELEHRSLQHGDLHAGNILVALPEFEARPRPSFRVTDFGLRDLTGTPEPASDFVRLAETLQLLLGKVRFENLGARDRYAYEVLRREFQGRHLLETDPTSDPLARNPTGLLEKLEALETTYYGQRRQRTYQKLLSPFDYPNGEQIGNSHLLLHSLYSDRLLGLAEIESRSNLILTGPRGCGKTTVFRALSLDYRLATDTDQPEDLGYVGIYYRCDDLYFAFPRYTTPKREEALNIPVHFLTVTLLALALEQLGAWAARHFPEEVRRQEPTVVSALRGLLGWSVSPSPVGHTLAALAARLRGAERKRAKKKQVVAHREDVPIEGYCGPGTLSEACAVLRHGFSFLAERDLYFFIDDYSDPKITKDLQANLNRLLLHRGPDAFFKLSTESPVSFARYDLDGKSFVESREFALVNLGLRYIKAKPGQILEFLQDLFSRRFREVEGYPVTSLTELLGSAPRNENAFARALRDPATRENYAGTEAIAAMCSGDIYYMIRLVGNMVEEFGGQSALSTSPEAPRIPAHQQNLAIRAAAGAFLESVRRLPQFGERLAAVVAAFGNVAHSYLRFRTASNRAGNPPHQASRIEPYGPLSMQDDASEILEALLRYSIFIEDPQAKSRRQSTVSRYYLRRYLLPHFRLTFSRRDSVQLESAEIELLLQSPAEFERRKVLRSSSPAPPSGPSGQMDLFE